jgi:tRNA-specific 2-thiouridylase
MIGAFLPANQAVLTGKFLFYHNYITVMPKVKAISLLSGGLDSILATELVRRQGIEVVAFNVKTPFGIPKKDGSSEAQQAAEQLKVPLKVQCVDKEYIQMLRNPKHGYGKNINPCVDCKIFILKQAKKYAKEIGADFLFTGEVLGERPMSQHGLALKTIAEEAGLKGKLLRPLSAKLMAETEAEKKGLIDRNKLLSIQGKSRKPQFALAKEYGITVYPSPAGGCLLTCEEYAKKLRDLFEHKKRITTGDIALLRIGRHFRVDENKIIVGRNKTENEFLAANRAESDYYFELPEIVGPISLLQGPKTKGAIETAAKLTAFYSDAKTPEVTVKYGKASLDKTLKVKLPQRADVDKLRVGNGVKLSKDSTAQ